MISDFLKTNYISKHELISCNTNIGLIDNYRHNAYHGVILNLNITTFFCKPFIYNVNEKRLFRES